MRLEVYPDYDALSHAGALWVTNVVRATPGANLVFALGNTPLGTYRLLADSVRRGEVSFSAAHLFQLDDYMGLAPDDWRSFRRWLVTSCAEPLGIPLANVVPLPSTAPDHVSACAAFEEQIAARGGIDAALLGLGINGHLGFNEPGSAFDSRTRCIELTPESVRSSATYWGSEEAVPRWGITMGLGTLREARQICLLVSGERKASILARTVLGGVGVDVPATCLRDHPDVVIMADREAARLIP